MCSVGFESKLTTTSITANSIITDRIFAADVWRLGTLVNVCQAHHLSGHATNAATQSNGKNPQSSYYAIWQVHKGRKIRTNILSLINRKRHKTQMYIKRRTSSTNSTTTPKSKLKPKLKTSNVNVSYEPEQRNTVVLFTIFS